MTEAASTWLFPLAIEDLGREVAAAALIPGFLLDRGGQGDGGRIRAGIFPYCWGIRGASYCRTTAGSRARECFAGDGIDVGVAATAVEDLFRRRGRRWVDWEEDGWSAFRADDLRTETVCSCDSGIAMYLAGADVAAAAGIRRSCGHKGREQGRSRKRDESHIERCAQGSCRCVSVMFVLYDG